MSDTVLSLRKATKLYAGVPAIEGVDFDLRRGEIHALVGENGAGKSTLTKVMAGVVTLTSGSMTVDGSDVAPRTPLEARNLGIAMVFQENSLVPTMTVAQNLFLGQEKFYNRLRGIYIAAQQFLQSLNFDVTPTATVGGLGAAKKQMVEIARAVLHKAKVIIFDEPTASLTPEEKKYFFDLVRDLKKRGVSIIFISHALEEALLLADRITVLRDGRHVVTDGAAGFDRGASGQVSTFKKLFNFIIQHHFCYHTLLSLLRKTILTNQIYFQIFSSTIFTFPFHTIPFGAVDVLFQLMARGITPIISHPERNLEITRRPERYYEMIRMGCFGQVTGMSLTGGFGAKIKGFAEKLLKKRLIYFIASDAHNVNGRPPIVSPAAKEAEKIVGREEAQKMVTEYPSAILEESSAAR